MKEILSKPVKSDELQNVVWKRFYKFTDVEIKQLKKQKAIIRQSNKEHNQFVDIQSKPSESEED